MFRLPALLPTPSPVSRPFLLPHAPPLPATRHARHARHARLSVRRASAWAAAQAEVDAQVAAWRRAHGERRTLLIVYHSRTGGAAAMAAAAAQGALDGLERPGRVPRLHACWDTAEFRVPGAIGGPGAPSAASSHAGNPGPGSGSAPPCPGRPGAPDSSWTTAAGPGVISGPGASDTPPSTSGTPAEADADAEGEADAVDVRVLPAPLAGPADLLTASGYVFVCPENLAALSGPMKDFFDRCFYPVLHRLNGRPYQALVCAGSDGAGAAAQLERIATGWRLRRVADTLVCNVRAQTEESVYAPKHLAPQDRDRCRDAGMRIAVGISVGMF